MIETCDPNIASWTEDGEMFTIKNPDLFASEVCKKEILLHTLQRLQSQHSFSSFSSPTIRLFLNTLITTSLVPLRDN
jgi:hypothetical protein